MSFLASEVGIPYTPAKHILVPLPFITTNIGYIWFRSQFLIELRKASREGSSAILNKARTWPVSACCSHTDLAASVEGADIKAQGWQALL